jgi:hypothetical protein
MKTIAASVSLAFIVACGGADQPPPAAPPPPPPPAPVADTAPAPAPPPPPAPRVPISDLQIAARKAMSDDTGDPAKFAALYAPDATLMVAGFPEAQGRDAILTWLQSRANASSDVKTTTVRSWQKGNVMADEFVSTGTDKATSKPWGVSGFEVLTFNDDGLITRDDTYVDYVTVLKQLGQYKGPTPARPVLSLPTGEPERHVSKGDAAEDANVQHLSDLNVSWARMDEKTALGLYADNAVTNDFTDDKPRDKKYAKEFWVAAHKAMKDPTWKDGTIFGCEDFTINEGEYSFRQVGDFTHGKDRLPNKKKTIVGHGAAVYQWKDGKVVKSWTWGNDLELAAQLGVGPAAPKVADAKKDAAKPPAPAK